MSFDVGHGIRGRDDGMRNALWALVLSVLFAGCATTGPAISKSAMGNLEINVYGADNQPVDWADIYLDGLFVGNLTGKKPILYVRNGERKVRVEVPGYIAYERSINILGEPNHQVLSVFLEPISSDKQDESKE